MISRLRFSGMIMQQKMKNLKKIELGMDARFEFSAPGTPQEKGVVERAFATLYGRVRTMLNYANI